MSKYTLHKKESKERNQFIVTIKADSNDGDYIIETSTYSKERFDEYVADALIDLVKNHGDHYQLKDYDNEYDLDIPYNGWDGFCHTLHSVKVEYVDEFGITWDVKLGG